MKTVISTQLTRLLVVSFLFGLTTCQKEDPAPKPVAFFTYSPTTNLVAPVTITLTNGSTDATEYLWQTSSGLSSTAKDVTWTIPSAGTYSISLKATGKGGSDTYSRTVTVATSSSTPNPTQPTAGFTYSPASNLTAPVTVTFTNTSANATSYAWDFGDGSTSISASPTHQYIKAGDFLVKLVATDAKNQTAQKTATVSVKAPVVAATTSNIDPFQYLTRYNSSYQSKDGVGKSSFTLTKPTPVVIMYTSRYSSQAALLSASEYTNFINNGAFRGWAIYDKQYGYQSTTLDPGTYYVGVRDVGGNKDNYYCYEVYYSTQIPASDRCEFVDIYIDNLKTLKAGEYLYHKFTIQDGFRYVFNGCYSSWNMSGYFIPESELTNYTSGRTFQYYKSYVAGADGTLAVEEIKLPAGNYYFVFKNTSSSLPLNITYFMERYRRL